jgi:hypothetical protein
MVETQLLQVCTATKIKIWAQKSPSSRGLGKIRNEASSLALPRLDAVREPFRLVVKPLLDGTREILQLQMTRFDVMRMIII